MTIAQKIMKDLQTIVSNESMDETAKYNECLASIQKYHHDALKNDRVISYVFEDNSSLVEINEEDYGGSVTWTIDYEFEDCVEISFDSYDYDDDDDYEGAWDDDDSDYEYSSTDRPVLWLN